MNKKGILLTVFVTAAALLFSAMAEQLYRRVETVAVPAPVVLIDAGHGGFDGGAVASDGTVEKDINLAMATELSVVLRLWGYRVEMTRDSDAALCEDESLTIREKKRADMAKRPELYDRASAVISIHQNHFPDASCRGTQVLYAPNGAESRALGEHVRSSILARMQPDNNRELKASTREVMLLYRTTAPAVLVECGFLSNPAELTAMKTTKYRRQMALAIVDGLLKFV